MAFFDDLSIILKYKNDPKNRVEVEKARRQLDQTHRSIGKLTKSAYGAAAAASGIGLGLAAGGAALVAFGKKSTDVFKEIQTNLSRVSGLVGIGADQLRAWVPDMQAIRRETGRTMGQLTAGLYDVTSAGLRGDVAMDTLRISAMASAAGMGETRVVADLLTSAINAWGPAALTAAQAGDDLAKAVELGKLPADALAGSMGSLIPIASEMGLEFGEMAGLMAAMSRTGTNAETAAVQLGQVLSLLLKPGKEAQETLSDLGFTAEELRDRVAKDGLLPVLQDLKNAFGDNEEQIAKVFPNIRALRGVFDLLGANLNTNVAIIDGMRDSQGKLGEAFHEVTDDVEFAEARTGAAIQNMMAQFGELTSPAVIEGLNLVAAGADAIGAAFERANAARAMLEWAGNISRAVDAGETFGALRLFEGMDTAERARELQSITTQAELEGVAPGQVLARRAATAVAGEMVAGEVDQAEGLALLDDIMLGAGGPEAAAQAFVDAVGQGLDAQQAAALASSDALREVTPEILREILPQIPLALHGAVREVLARDFTLEERGRLDPVPATEAQAAIQVVRDLASDTIRATREDLLRAGLAQEQVDVIRASLPEDQQIAFDAGEQVVMQDLHELMREEIFRRMRNLRIPGRGVTPADRRALEERLRVDEEALTEQLAEQRLVEISASSADRATLRAAVLTEASVRDLSTAQTADLLRLVPSDAEMTPQEQLGETLTQVRGATPSTLQQALLLQDLLPAMLSDEALQRGLHEAGFEVEPVMLALNRQFDETLQAQMEAAGEEVRALAARIEAGDLKLGEATAEQRQQLGPERLADLADLPSPSPFIDYRALGEQIREAAGGDVEMQRQLLAPYIRDLPANQAEAAMLEAGVDAPQAPAVTPSTYEAMSPEQLAADARAHKFAPDADAETFAAALAARADLAGPPEQPDADAAVSVSEAATATPVAEGTPERFQTPLADAVAAALGMGAMVPDVTVDAEMAAAENTPGLAALEMAAAGPIAPAPISGDTFNTATTEGSRDTHVTEHHTWNIYGATDPTAVAAAIDERLQLQSRAATEARDPGVDR